MKRITLATCLAIGLFGAFPAQAATCSAGGGNAADPQIVDPANDFQGIAFGNGSALIPYGDVYREGTDLTGVWIDAPTGTPSTPTYTAKVHVQVANLAGNEGNAVFYVKWDYVDDPNITTDDGRIDRYVSANVSARGAFTAEYGYTAPGSGGVTNITSQGSISGATGATGAGGGFTIPAPLKKLGNIQPGTVLTGVVGESRVLIGAAGTGLLGIADDTTNADPTCADITI